MKIAAFAFAGLAVAASAASAAVYSGSGFSMPDNSPDGVSSVITVSGDTPSITAVEVTLQGFTHTYIGDINATLTSPSGTVFPLMMRIGSFGPGGFGDWTNLNGDYRFTDTAAGTLWSAADALLDSDGTIGIASGDYRTTDLYANVATSLNAAFGGQNSNGDWTLTMSDNAGVDIGGIQGWTLSVVPTPGSLAIFGLAGIAAGRRRR
jgi:hypothetical protein